MACLKDSIMQGYLVDFAPDPLRPIVETHLASCPRCRAAFDDALISRLVKNYALKKIRDAIY